MLLPVKKCMQSNAFEVQEALQHFAFWKVMPKFSRDTPEWFQVKNKVKDDNRFYFFCQLQVICTNVR